MPQKIVAKKNVIVGGIPRSGKTTLARRIAADYKLTLVSQDTLVKAFEKSFPELEISNDAPNYNNLCDKIRPFLFEHLLWLSRYQIPFVLDAYYLRPEDLSTLQVEGGFVSVFLGYSETDVNKKLKNIRSNEHEWDWTTFFSDTEVNANLAAFVKASQRLRGWCEESHHPYVDTGTNWSAGIERAFQIVASGLA